MLFANMGATAHLTIVCGLPGSGKTTVASAIAAERGAFRCNADDWFDRLGIDLWNEPVRARVEEVQWMVARQFLRHGVDVVVEWGTWSRSQRDRLREEAREIGATVELILLDAPVDELWNRVDRRGREDPPISVEHLIEWSTLIERPTLDEFALFDSSRPPTTADDHLDELIELETAMWRGETRGDREWMEHHLAPEFEEFGRSGRHWSRSEVIDAEVGEIHAQLPLLDLRIRSLASDVAHITYRSVVRGEHARRSSVWRREFGRWFMVFHQGTPINPDPTPTSS